MKRYQAEMAMMRRRSREGSRLGKAQPAGYYRKQDAHDCGNPRCGLCHREKRFGHTLTRQELATALKQREQMAT